MHHPFHCILTCLFPFALLTILLFNFRLGKLLLHSSLHTAFSHTEGKNAQSCNATLSYRYNAIATTTVNEDFLLRTNLIRSSLSSDIQDGRKPQRKATTFITSLAILTLFSDFKTHFSVHLSTWHFLTQKEKYTKLQSRASGIMQLLIQQSMKTFWTFQSRVDDNTRSKW